MLAWNNVPDEPGDKEQAAAARLMETAAPDLEVTAPPKAFADQIALVRAVQRAVLDAAPVDDGIPLGQARELSDLMKRGKGLCYDRSRAIETVLNHYGMRTRHVSIFSTRESGSTLEALATPRIPSHAVSEVLTEKGWMAIDSNRPWIGLTADGRAIGVADLQSDARKEWAQEVEADVNPIFRRPFTFVYGLYSRHGRFYPPYLPIPDINWRQFLYNLE
ncbi:hypothetical protein A7A08_00519 [Methyloligella halotolerans]|uniref:Transglutaminase-like domain-containing protein n=1 Tax=Methyloligella halotolerans TaxID=1177755 RepID=A0A1E2S2H9_9HYPH|nr:hypothetical protein A7A08_00519 [Methyloligella halotolerans]